ncbi:MAG: glycosyltransferase [Flavobacteriaceae bacterium]|nr:glycosyltransferase [Flavobacteriaceae bacterium]
MIFISIVISLIYSILILFFIIGFDKIDVYKSKNKSVKTNFTIIIPFRNEALNLTNLLNSLAALNYPLEKFEIVLVNDNSNDGFNSIINSFKAKHNNIDLMLIDNIRKSNAPKKDAIDIGIETSKYEWIITTDADCILPKNWLITLDNFIQYESPKMVVSPVAFQIRNKFIDNFQNLDFLSLQGSTIGGFGMDKPFLCNGANLCYSKVAFSEVNGFKGNNKIASGDDIFLLEKMINQFPKKVKYLKSTDVLVKTKPEKIWKQLLQQRIRWASKTTAYENNFGKMVGVIVFITNTYLIVLFILAIVKIVFWSTFGLFFLVKFNIDFILLYKISLFFKCQSSLKIYLTSSVLHPIFTVFVGLLSFKKGYQWKGRQFHE